MIGIITDSFESRSFGTDTKAQNNKWFCFYKQHKTQRLSDEEILSRYIFVVVGETLGLPRYEGFYFPQYAPSREEILESIADGGPLTKEEIQAITGKIDREGEAAFASMWDAMLTVVKSADLSEDDDPDLA